MFDDYDDYVDFKKMYFKMLRAAEEAMNTLIEAQRECEEIYLEATNLKMNDWMLDEFGNEK